MRIMIGGRSISGGRKWAWILMMSEGGSLSLSLFASLCPLNVPLVSLLCLSSIYRLQPRSRRFLFSQSMHESELRRCVR